MKNLTKLGLIVAFVAGVLSFSGCGEQKTPYEQLQEAREKEKEKAKKEKE